MNELEVDLPELQAQAETMNDPYKQYRHELAKKGQAALKERAAKGLYRGAIPLGYKKKLGKDRIPSLEVDPGSCRLFLAVFELNEAGCSIQQITDTLNQRRFKSARGGKLSKATVWRLVNRMKSTYAANSLAKSVLSE